VEFDGGIKIRVTKLKVNLSEIYLIVQRTLQRFLLTKKMKLFLSTSTVRAMNKALMIVKQRQLVHANAI